MTSWLRKLGGNRRRIVVAAVVGILIALVLIWLLTTLYDPFATEIEDLRALMPEDLDVIVEIRDVPTFAKGLESRPFWRALDESEGFRRFLASERVRGTEAVPLVGEALKQLRAAGSNTDLPFDLQVFGDLTGRQIVVGGLAPAEGEEPRFVAAFQPESAWALVAVNALLDETLCSWFVADRVPEATFRHVGWGVEITYADAKGVSRTLGVARVERAVLVGNDLELLPRIAKRGLAGSFGFAPPPRYEDGWAWRQGDLGASVHLLARRRVVEERVGLVSRFLEPMWGAELAGAFERLFPDLPPDGDDRISVEIAREARLTVGMTARGRRETSPLAEMAPLDRTGVSLRSVELLERMPWYVFGWAWLEARPGAIARHLLSDPALMDADKRELWFDELSQRIERFSGGRRPGGPVPDLSADLARELDACFERGVGVALFRKEREDGGADAVPGVAAAFRVKDRERLDQLIDEIDRAVDASGARAFERHEGGGLVTWRIANTTFLDNPVDNRPGFALIGDTFLFTNWIRLFEDMRRVGARELEGFGWGNQIGYAFDSADEAARGLLVLQGDRLYDFMDQAKEAWVEERARISDQELFAEVTRLEAEARLREIPTDQQSAWIDRRIREWRRDEERKKNPALIRREIDANLDQFRGVFRAFIGSVGLEEGRLRIDLRLDAAGT